MQELDDRKKRLKLLREQQTAGPEQSPTQGSRPTRALDLLTCAAGYRHRRSNLALDLDRDAGQEKLFNPLAGEPKPVTQGQGNFSFYRCGHHSPSPASMCVNLPGTARLEMNTQGTTKQP